VTDVVELGWAPFGIGVRKLAIFPDDEIKCMEYRAFEEGEVDCYMLKSILKNFHLALVNAVVGDKVETLLNDVLDRFMNLPYCMYEAVGCKGLPLTYKMIWDRRCVAAGVELDDLLPCVASQYEASSSEETSYGSDAGGKTSRSSADLEAQLEDEGPAASVSARNGSEHEVQQVPPPSSLQARTPAKRDVEGIPLTIRLASSSQVWTQNQSDVPSMPITSIWAWHNGKTFRSNRPMHAETHRLPSSAERKPMGNLPGTTTRTTQLMPFIFASRHVILYCSQNATIATAKTRTGA
jgi:hypothetical protein